MNKTLSDQIVTQNAPLRLVVGVTSASGAVYAVRLLDALGELGVERHLVLSKTAPLTLKTETDLTPADLHRRAEAVYAAGDVGAAIASGSFRSLGMVVVPCSVRTLSEISTGVTSSLLTRAADVMLKERRRLVLMVRETPFHLGHLRAMTAVTEMGAIVAPPLPAFYIRPKSIDELVDQSVGRVLDLFGFAGPGVRRWGEDIGPPPPAGGAE